MINKERRKLVNIVHPRTMTTIIITIISFSSLFIFSVFYGSLSDTIDIFSQGWIVFIFIPLIYFWTIWSEFTHKVSWDDEAIYFRPQCEPWEIRNRPIAKIKFEDIESINGKMPNKSRYIPNMKIRILGKTHPEHQYDGFAEIKIDNFKRSSFNNFISFLKEKRPDIF